MERAFPSIWTMVKSAAKAWWYFFTSGCQKLPKYKRDERHATCLSCHELCRMRCSLCGCFVAVKTYFPKEACPVRKWTEEL